MTISMTEQQHKDALHMIRMVKELICQQQWGEQVNVFPSTYFKPCPCGMCERTLNYDEVWNTLGNLTGYEQERDSLIESLTLFIEGNDADLIEPQQASGKRNFPWRYDGRGATVKYSEMVMDRYENRYCQRDRWNHNGGRKPKTHRD